MAFLEQIHYREIILKQMWVGVKEIQSDAFFFSDEKQASVQMMSEAEKAVNHREKMRQLGNQLVELTDNLIKSQKSFLKDFNRYFSYVKLETVIFMEADYLEIAVKEVKEISSIFASYEIQLILPEQDYNNIQVASELARTSFGSGKKTSDRLPFGRQSTNA